MTRVEASAPTRGPVVVTAKIHPPTRARALVPRPELVERLEAEPLPRLTLLGAPPGWGKTTILADWASSAAGRRFAWVSLDAGDNDPVRFWLYAVAALRRAAPGVGAEADGLLRSPASGVVDMAIGGLVNELEDLEERVVLVLDDLHLVTNGEIHEQLVHLVERLPDALRLVLATRADPPLPLARLRARGDLRELRAEHLRFSGREADTFLNDVLGLALDPTDVALLHGRTEGWAAGIYLAALSLEGREDRRRYIQAFAGDDRHVVDYLVSEVLERQPEALREFLLRTSILERLSGPLCDAVRGEGGSAERLADIERSNLFLVPLDTTRTWYRYHHLFADLLRHELERSRPDSVGELHRRASAWHREHGSVSQAIGHAVSAGDLAEAADLVALHWNDYVNQGRSETVAAWVGRLPAETVRGDARLCLARAGAALTLGRRAEVEPWLHAAERAPLGGESRHGASSVEAEVAIYRAVHLYMTGDFEAAIGAGRRAVELERDPSSPWRAMACAALGRSLFWQGDADAAAPQLEEAIRLRRPTSNNLSVVGAAGYLAAIQAEQGEHAAAERLAAAALRMSDEAGLAEHWVGLPALVARAQARRERGDVAGAERDALRAVELGRRGAGGVEMAFALAALADVVLVSGGAAEARLLVDEARRAAGPTAGALARVLDRLERRLRPPGRRAPEREPAPEELSGSELAVLRLIPSDRSLREIGSALFISQNTVKMHTRAIYRKLAASSRGEAVARARDLGLL